MLAALASHLAPAARPHPASADQKQLEAKAHPPSARGEGGEGGEAVLEPVFTAVPRFEDTDTDSRAAFGPRFERAAWEGCREELAVLCAAHPATPALLARLNRPWSKLAYAPAGPLRERALREAELGLPCALRGAFRAHLESVEGEWPEDDFADASVELERLQREERLADLRRLLAIQDELRPGWRAPGRIPLHVGSE